MKLDFMVAGVQKGGTSALYQHLRAHPEIGMPSRKECHFFDDNSHDWTAPDYEVLHCLYQPGHRLYGESTPITIHWSKAHERIRAYNPDMSFILLVRDPVERAYSHWCMLYSRGVERLPFDEAIRAGRNRIGNKPRKFSYVERGFYGAQVEALLGVLPQSRILFLMSEDLRADHAAAMRQIGNFLDVDPACFGSEQVIANTKAPITYPSVLSGKDRDYLRELYSSDTAKFACTSGLDISRWKSFA